jgi:hypothetical protein
VADLAKQGVIHRDVQDIFTGYSLYQHQLEAIRLGAAGKETPLAINPVDWRNWDEPSINF